MTFVSRARTIASVRDVEAIEARPYDEFVPHASVPAALEQAALEHADRPALTFIVSAELDEPPLRWTHREFVSAVRRTANLFHRIAAGEEPRIAMLMPAIPQAYFALWGGETAGVVCPINYLLTAEHIAELVRASGANILVALGPNAELDVWSRVAAVRKTCAGLRAVLAVGGAPDADDFDTLLMRENGDRLTFERRIGRDTLAALFHTGGTTGAPKLAQHTHGNQLHASWGAARFYGTTPRDVMVNGFPLFHVAGSFVFGLSTLLAGGAVLLPTLLGMRNPAYVARYWQFVERHGATLLAAVPTVLSTLVGVASEGARLDSVRALLTGGSPLPDELAASFESRHGIAVRNILGMTECAGVISIEPVAGPRVPGSCGLRLPFTEVLPFAGEPAQGHAPCPPGVAGILHVRGPNVGPGYTDETRNAGTFLEGGWLASGDLGEVDEDGRIFITGRAKDVIIRSGHNIDPAVIEETLMRHPDVAFAAAVGEPDAYAGELPVAYVALKPGSEVDETALLAFASERIPERPACPKRVEILPTLPLTAIGKVYKPALRLRAIESAIREHLAHAALGSRVGVLGRDTPAGLVLDLACIDGARDDALEKAVRSTLAPFAISWQWTR